MSSVRLTTHSDSDSTPLPVTHGRLLDFPDDPLACMRKLHAEHGPIAALEEDGQRIHFVFSPEYNHQVLSDANTFHSRFFAIRGPRNSPHRRLTSGLLSMNGEQHKRNRRLVMEAFQKKSIQSYHPTIVDLTNQLLAGWSPGEERDINRDMTEFMLRVTSTILFGVDEPERAYRLGRMIDHWVEMNHRLGMGAFVSDAAITNQYDDLLDYAGELEQEILGLIQKRRGSSQQGIDVLSLLIRAHDEQGSITDEELVGNAALLFGAAHLTTAHTLTWTLFLLAEHPSIMRRLHGELLDTLDGDAPSLDQVERLHLTERIIKESMRVLPASSYSQRIAGTATDLGPFRLNRGSAVIFSQFITHHRSDIYPEPEVFRPDRWLTQTPSPYAYLPFGNGPRMCVGATLAMLTLKTALPTILQRFRVSVVPNCEVSGKIISTMLGPTTTVLMRIDEQDGRFECHPVRGNIHEMVDLHEVHSGRRRRAA